MTTGQIVKALRVCGESRFCKECPSNELKDTMGVYPCADLLMMKTADLIEQQAERIAELEAKVPRWIPVTERLPEVHQNTRKSEAMLVYTRRKLFMVAIWNGIDWLAPMDFWDAWGDEIVYWMPLPEAAKEV